MRILSTILLFISLAASAADHGPLAMYFNTGLGKVLYYSGSRYTCPTHSGQATVNMATEFAAPVTSADTVVFTGTFNAYPNLSRGFGLLADSAVLDFTGALHNGTSYAQGMWSDMNYIKVIGLKAVNHYGSIVITDSIKNIRFTACKFLNDPGNYQNAQFVIQIGTSSNAAMQCNSGQKDKTFYGFRFDHDTLNGFQNAVCIANINDGAYNLMEDVEIDHLYVRNLTNTTTLSPGIFGGTVLNFNIHHNDMQDFQSDASACRCVHAEWFYINGYGEFAYNTGKRQFGSLLRVYPAVYSGLSGYGSGSIYIHDNYSEKQISYSMFEANDSLPSALTTLGFDNSTIITTATHNTLDSSSTYTYDPAHPTDHAYHTVWNGCIIDAFTTNVHAYNNLSVHAYFDTTYNIFPAFINTMSRTGSDTAGNQKYQYALQAGLDSAHLPAIIASSPAINAAANKTPEPSISINGKTRPGHPNNDAGAWEYVTPSGKGFLKAPRKK